MPWTCKQCDTDVQEDDAPCPACAATKTSWTMVADRTRTLVFSGRKTAYLRGQRIHTYPPDHEAHALPARVTTETAPVVRKACARAMAERGHLPPSWHTLHVRLHPAGRKQVPLTVSVNFEAAEVVDHDLPHDAPPVLRPDGSFDARVLLVYGAGPPPDEDAFAGVRVIDVTEVGPDGAPTLAPSIDVAAMGKQPKRLPTEDAGALELGTVWLQAFDALDGAPIADALVHLRAHGEDDEAGEGDLEVVGATDGEGVLRWEHVPLGVVTAELEGYEALAVPVLDPDAPEEPFRGWFHPLTGRLLVTAHDERGEPLAGASYDVDGRVARSGVTDDQGRLEHLDVPHGVYTLHVDGHLPAAVPTIHDRDVDDGAALEPYRVLLRADGSPGTISLEVFDAAGAPLVGVPYRIDGPRAFQGTTGPDGRLRHPDVPLDYYTLQLDGHEPVAFPALADEDGSYALQVRA